MNPSPDSNQRGTNDGKAYRKKVLVRFSDCDPAGIVFYPKYFEMLNNLIEDWCRDELRFSFNEIITDRGWGLPTVHLETDFHAPSTFGEALEATLRLRNLGTTSIALEFTLRGMDGVLRVGCKAVLVLIDRSTTRAIPFPSDVRERLASFADAVSTKTVADPK
jgi:4-hydroxybenzoyl-CoA thioesterase